MPKMIFLNSFKIKLNRNIPQVSTLEYRLSVSISNQHEKLKYWYLPCSGSLMLSYNCLTTWFIVCYRLVSPQGTGYVARVLQSYLCCGIPQTKPFRRDGGHPGGIIPSPLEVLCHVGRFSWMPIDMLIEISSLPLKHFILFFIFREVYFIKNLFSAEKSTS